MKESQWNKYEPISGETHEHLPVYHNICLMVIDDSVCVFSFEQLDEINAQRRSDNRDEVFPSFWMTIPAIPETGE